MSKEDESKLLITQQDSPLFDQIRVVKNKSIDDLHISEVIIVEAKKSKEHNDKIKQLIRNGFKYNDIHYKRFGKSASQAKAGITVFISEDIYDEIMKRSQIDIEILKTVISKYEAQRCLILTTCTLIQQELPYIVIVDEFKKIVPNQYIRYVVESKKSFIDKETGKEKEYTAREIEEGYVDVEISPFDGGGVHSLEYSETISKELELDYTAIGFQIRLPFMKGYSVAFDFKRYFKEVIGINTITDIFGKAHNVDDIDCIWNTTMWKCSKLFKQKYDNDGFDKYLEVLDKYQYKLGISKYSHHTKDLNLKSRMNFQYLQCLDLWNKKYIQHYDNKFQDEYDILDENKSGKIIGLAKYTTNLFQNIINGDKFYTCKFLGKNSSQSDSEDNAMMKAILINDTMLKDVAVRKNVYRKLKKQITKMKLGKIYCDGFYHTAVIDVVGYLEYCAGVSVVGCLRDREFYSNTLGVGEFTSFRSPLVCPSEVNNIRIVELNDYRDWFAHFENQDVIMFNTYDISLPQQGGEDLDGDANYICKDPIIYESKINKPIIININDKATVKEVEYNLDNIVKYEMDTRDSRIGEITNVATSILNQRNIDKKWSNIAYDNISLLRIYQGVEIDSIKTGFRWHLNKYLRNYLKQLPMFLLYNYPNKLDKYFRLKEKNREDKDNRVKLNGFNSPSPMNELCEYINSWEKRNIIWDRSYVDTRCLILNKEYSLSNKDICRQVKHLINEYVIELKNFIKDNEDDESLNGTIDKLTNKYKTKINNLLPDKIEIANYVIKVSYSSLSMNKSFVWKAYGNYILKNLIDNSPEKQHYEIVCVNQKTETSMEFLGKEYEMRLINV